MTRNVFKKDSYLDNVTYIQIHDYIASINNIFKDTSCCDSIAEYINIFMILD